MHFYFLVFIAIFASLHSSSAISINIEPSRFTGEKEKTVKISCALDQADSTAKSIVLMRINGKGSKSLVVIHSNNTIQYVNGKPEQYQAEGKVEKDIFKSHLSMTIKKPVPDDAGAYKCHIFYMDNKGQLVREKASNILVVEDPEVKGLSKTVNELVEKVKTATDDLTSLVTKEQNNEDTLKKLEDRLEERLKQLEGATSTGTVTPLVAFTATNTDKFIFPKTGQSLIFPDVILNVGQGYDRNSGVFRAPEDGLYAFHLVVESACATCTVSVDLRNDYKVLITLKTGDNNIRDQSSVSTVVKLRAGNIVKTVVTNTTPGAYLTFHKRTIFSGYLVNSA